MDWDWLGYRQFAEKNRGSFDECDQRNCISRGYYFAFHRACEYIKETTGESPPRKNSHEWAIKLLKDGTAKEKDEGDRLEMLRGYRNQADYNKRFKDVTIRAKYVSQTLADADKLVKNLSLT